MRLQRGAQVKRFPATAVADENLDGVRGPQAPVLLQLSCVVTGFENDLGVWRNPPARGLRVSDPNPGGFIDLSISK